MGRRKVKMELQSDEKSRNLSFKKRKASLIKKLQELTTLCEVKACIIIYGPHGSGVEPEFWPQNLDETRQILEDYKAKKGDSGCKKFELSDYFNMRKKELEKEVSKLREKNNNSVEANYPTPVEMLNLMNGSQLREFGAALKNKAEFVKSRIQVLKLQSGSTSIMDSSDSRLVSNYPPMPSPNHYNYQQLGVGGTASMDFGDSSLLPMMFVMNEDDQFGYGGASTSTTSMGVDCYNPWQSCNYYQPPPPPYAVAAPPQLHFPTGWENQNLEDIVNYQMSFRYQD